MARSVLPGETIERGTCINHGCDDIVADSGKAGKSTFRAVCDRCHKAGLASNKMQYREGVIPYKTGVCENYRSGILEFACLVNHTSELIGMRLTDLHHLNHNHKDNRLENVAELCKMCHLVEHRRTKK